MKRHRRNKWTYSRFWLIWYHAVFTFWVQYSAFKMIVHGKLYILISQGLNRYPMQSFFYWLSRVVIETLIDQDGQYMKVDENMARVKNCNLYGSTKSYGFTVVWKFENYALPQGSCSLFVKWNHLSNICSPRIWRFFEAARSFEIAGKNSLQSPQQ